MDELNGKRPSNYSTLRIHCRIQCTLVQRITLLCTTAYRDWQRREPAKAQEYEREAEDVSQSFKKIFLNEYGYLLDYVDGPMMDWSVRPNQIFAIALDFSPLDLKERKKCWISAPKNL